MSQTTPSQKQQREWMVSRGETGSDSVVRRVVGETTYAFAQVEAAKFELALEGSPWKHAKRSDAEQIHQRMVESARDTAKSDIKAKISGLPADEQRKIEGRLGDIDAAHSMAAIKAIAADIQIEITLAMHHDTAEKGHNEEEARKEKMAHLWGEIGRLNKEIDTEFDKLSKWTTDEQKEQRERDKARVEAAAAALKAAKTPEQISTAQAEYKSASETQTQHDKQTKASIDRQSGGTADTKHLGTSIDARTRRNAQIYDGSEKGLDKKQAESIVLHGTHADSSVSSVSVEKQPAEKTKILVASEGVEPTAFPRIASATSSRNRDI